MNCYEEAMNSSKTWVSIDFAAKKIGDKKEKEKRKRMRNGLLSL